MARLFNKIGNAFMMIILKSPLHAMLSRSICIITVRGRKTGIEYRTPVNYLRDGAVIWITSISERTWWRNLRAGQQVSLRIRGQNLTGQGNVIEGNEAVTQAFYEYLQLVPSRAKYFNVNLDPAGMPIRSDIAEAAKNRVMVRIELD
ncbi:MAG: nitroreductase family deazaflavin-dependent oxidoreductase [Anaerolineales bacterium]|nr:nitroreductase family deazaflavin-dependent oxidoreductase [Anaerolineales bacterium]